MPAPISSNSMLRLTISGLGHVVSFKNQKVLITKGPGGRPLRRPLLVTKGSYKKQMVAIVKSFESQLFSKSRTTAVETGTEPLPPSSIALLLPGDDSVSHIPELHVYVERVEVGDEGAEIIIEKL